MPNALDQEYVAELDTILGQRLGADRIAARYDVDYLDCLLEAACIEYVNCLRPAARTIDELVDTKPAHQGGRGRVHDLGVVNRHTERDTDRVIALVNRARTMQRLAGTIQSAIRVHRRRTV